MPRNQFQRVIFALLSVIFTVHGYVFYSLYVVNGAALMGVTGAPSVLAAIRSQGGVYMCGRFTPIWAVVLTEFCLAFLLENIMGSPCSFKLAAINFDPRQTHPVLFETAIICATVGLMCPAMSLIAAVFRREKMTYPSVSLQAAILNPALFRITKRLNTIKNGIFFNNPNGISTFFAVKASQDDVEIVSTWLRRTIGWDHFKMFTIIAFLRVEVVSRVMRKFALVSGRNLLQGGGLTAPWLLFSRQGAKRQGRRYAARLALDPLRPGCYHPA